MTTIYTIGHSTREIEAFIALLKERNVQLLVDVRTIPKSRRNPHFGDDQLPQRLTTADINYRHMEHLGGLRKTSKTSINGAWRNASFRGYADYMQTDQFQHAIGELIVFAAELTTAIMCAEAVPWRCHRSLVADALVVRGVEVIDIMGPGKTRVDELTSFAQVDGQRVTYPPKDDDIA